MNLFGKSKAIIGMIHLGKLIGQNGYKDEDCLIEKAITDLKIYEEME